MSVEKAVYLAGPITGLSYTGATTWREHATTELAKDGIAGVSPLRGKTYLEGAAKLAMEYHQAMSTSRGIMTRDFFDCTRCGAVLAFLAGADRVSVGTVMEMAWTYQARIPLIVVMEPSGNPHEHAMVSEATGYRVETLDEGLDVAKWLFRGYTPGMG